VRVPYAAASYGRAEIDAVLDVLENPAQLVPGPAVAEFERRVSEMFGKPHGLMVNSGSSANLLALAALDLPPGSEVITPALTFATTVAPILQLGLRPVFVDVEPDTYVVDMFQVLDAVTERTSAALIPWLLGNAPRGGLSTTLLDGVPIIADCCDTIGHRAPQWADVVTTSFYASHVITCAGGGGMACFADEAAAKRARLLSRWGRASALMGENEDAATRWAGEYDAKFLFPAAGYNMQPLELQAAFGLAQLDLLPERLVGRRQRWEQLYGQLSSVPGIALAVVTAPYSPNWLAFPFRVLDSAPFTRRDLALHLEAHGIQTRPVMAGNILRQPGFFRCSGRRPEEFPNTDAVHRGGLLVGCHEGLAASDIDYVVDTIRAFAEGVWAA
jgi:CDP-6-deoxy-D-xylo-4-hexulose-3-dehydrase